MKDGAQEGLGTAAPAQSAPRSSTTVPLTRAGLPKDPSKAGFENCSLTQPAWGHPVLPRSLIPNLGDLGCCIKLCNNIQKFLTWHFQFLPSARQGPEPPDSSAGSNTLGMHVTEKPPPNILLPGRGTR